MKATAVIARFLSLLDVTLILLGLLMIVLMQAQLRSDAGRERSSPEGLAQLAEILNRSEIDFVYLYAGWKGGENGRCFLLTAENKIGREIRIDTADDIQEVLTARQKSHSQRANQVVMLLFSDDGWYSAWDTAKLAAMEQIWKVKVIPVYNVRLPH